ncbi:MAG: hypothetical protein WA981_16220 [Glaciecola sp.]
MTQASAQVFIATTKGLVQVQSITQLEPAGLASVVTVNQSARLAGISRDYPLFIEQPQGVISRNFGGQAYRMDISAPIDTGASWQLGTYIAHYLYFHNTLATDDASTVLIATGCINTLHNTVSEVTELSTKCTVATQQIQQFIADGKRIVFLIPRQNYQQPLPDIAVEVTPVADLAQVDALMKALNLSSTHLVNTNTELVDTLLNETSSNEQVDVQYSQAPTISASPRIKTVYKILVFTPLLLLAWWLSTNTGKLNYAFEVDISDGKTDCDMSQAQQIDSGILTSLHVLPASPLNRVCQMRLITSGYITDVWLVSENGFVIALPMPARANDMFISSAPLEWSIPLPSVDDESRSYYLLAFLQPQDTADLQSLRDYLAQRRTSGAMPDFVQAPDLFSWANRLNKKPFYIKHSLIK